MKKNFFKNFKIRLSYLVFSSYFYDKKSFNDFLNNLSDAKQEKFLRLSIFYRNFVQEPLVKDKFTRNCFSLIMLFSLIEALMSEEKHLTFDEYLLKNFNPIPDKVSLSLKQEEYIKKFGSRRQVQKFFNDYVDNKCKEIFAYAIRTLPENKYKKLSINKRIELNIQLFYQWRCDFVHSAKTPGAFQEFGLQLEHVRRKKIIFTTAYQREDFELLFEHGFLRYFGCDSGFTHDNFEEKIDRYKKHTGINIQWESIKEKINQA